MLPLVGYEGYYEVSDQGNVRSVTRLIYAWNGISKARKTYTGRPMTPVINKDGYRIVRLSRNNITRSHRISRMVASVFIGPCPNGHECAHKNGISADDRAKNLKWATPKENMEDQIRHGTFRRAKGEDQGFSKLKTEQVLEIKRLRNSGRSAVSIARLFNISGSHVCKISSGKTWRHIE